MKKFPDLLRMALNVPDCVAEILESGCVVPLRAAILGFLSLAGHAQERPRYGRRVLHNL